MALVCSAIVSTYHTCVYTYTKPIRMCTYYTPIHIIPLHVYTIAFGVDPGHVQQPSPIRRAHNGPRTGRQGPLSAVARRLRKHFP